VPLVLVGLSMPFQTQAQTSTDHINDLIDQPGGAGLGFVIRTEISPYKDSGNRSDLLPLYLYEGEHF